MKQIQLTQGQVALIDDEDFEQVSKIKWHASAKGSQKKFYAQNKNTKRFILMHRFIMNAPEGMVVDHIDGNGLNNQRSNLEIVTFEENTFRTHAKRRAAVRDDICL